jgi:hypothetical protein
MSAFSRRVSLPRVGRVWQALLMFLLGLVPLSAWSASEDARHPEWRVGTIYARDLPLPGKTEFLSQDPDLLDYDVYYHGLHDWAQYARRTDVIFTGNSRAMYAFHREAVRPVFERLGLTYYNLAFAGGADVFPLAIIRRFDLHPKVLVVNVHGFFANDPARWGTATMQRDWFGAWQLVWEREMSWIVRRRLHAVLPHLPTLIVHRKSEQVIYRRIDDGTWRWVMPIIEPKPIGGIPERHTDDAAENAGVDRWSSIMASNAPDFIKSMEERGTAVVLVYVPWSDQVGYYSALSIAKQLGKPLVVAWPDGLVGAVGSHLGEESARRYVDALVPMLLDLPEFRRLVATESSLR